MISREQDRQKNQGTRIKRRINRISIIVTAIGVVFIAIFVNETLSLGRETIMDLLKVAVCAAVLSRLIFLVIIFRWLGPLAKFLDISAEEAKKQYSENELLFLVEKSISYPVRHYILSLSTWTITAIIICSISYYLKIIVLNEAIVICNTIFLTSIVANMIAYFYVDDMIKPLIERAKQLHHQLVLPPEISGTVRRQIMGFVIAIMVFLLLFFVQLISIASIYQSKEVLKQHGKDFLLSVSTKLNRMDTQSLLNLSEVSPEFVLTGVDNFFLAKANGEIVYGEPGELGLQNFTLFMQGIRDIDEPVFRPFTIYKRLHSLYFGGVVCELKSFQSNKLRMTPMYLFFFLFMSFLILFLAKQIAQSISMSIMDLSYMMREISKGEGDLSQRIIVHSNRELIELSGWFNQFMKRLSMMIDNIKNVAEQVTSSTNRLQGGSDQFVKEAKSQYYIVQQAVKAADGAISASRQIEIDLDRAIDRCDKSIEDSEMSNATLQELKTTTVTIESHAYENADILQNLYEKSEAVQGILASVEQLADQTRLLAFNAMIESVGAGEKGSRFSKVAEEVRELADNITRATTDTSDIIPEMLEDLSELVSRYDLEKKNISKLSSYIQNVESDLSAIVSSSSEIKQRMKTANSEISMMAELLTDSKEAVSALDRNTKFFIEEGSEFQKIITKLSSITKIQDEQVKAFKI